MVYFLFVFLFLNFTLDKRTVQGESLFITVKLKPKTFESLCFSVSGFGATVIVLLLYRPGSVPPMEAFFKKFTDYMEIIALYNCQIIVAGDFNPLTAKETFS